MIHAIHSSPHPTTHTGVPIIGAGREPVWFTRRAAEATRLRELRRDEAIARLQGRSRESRPVLLRVRSVLGLA